MNNTGNDVKEKTYLSSLQGLRAFAFLAIFMHHTGSKMFVAGGPWGVSAFMILSGYLMLINYYMQNRIKHVSLRENFIFSVKKILPLFSLHIITLILSFPLEKGVWNSDRGLFFKKLSLNSLLLQAWVPDAKIYYSFNALSWYLSACMFFYFCFPWLLIFAERKLTKKNTIPITLILVVLEMVIELLVGITCKTNVLAKWICYIFPLVRIIDFMVGILGGYLFLRGAITKINQYKWVPLLILSMFLLAWYIANIFLERNKTVIGFIGYAGLYTVLNFLIIVYASNENWFVRHILNNKIIQFIGSVSSYAYLISSVVMLYINTYLKRIMENNSIRIIINSIVSLCITILLSYFTKKIVKKLETCRNVT